MENSHPINDLMSTTLQKIREMVDVNTIVGAPITTPDETVIIPISKVCFGFGSGGTDYKMGKGENDKVGFGGGGGAGISIVPIAFLICSQGDVRLLPVTAPPNSSVDRVIEAIPGLVDKVSSMLSKDKKQQKSKMDPNEEL